MRWLVCCDVEVLALLLPIRAWRFQRIVSILKKRCPQKPVVTNGNGELLKGMKDTGVDVIGLYWTMDMAGGRNQLGHDISVQGNVDPVCLFSPLQEHQRKLVPFFSLLQEGLVLCELLEQMILYGIDQEPVEVRESAGGDRV